MSKPEHTICTWHKFRGYIKSHWAILLVSALVFAIVCGGGFSLATLHSRGMQKEAHDGAIDLANETGIFFRDAFDKAMMPLFSLAQFATEIPMFRELPDRIGPTGQNGSLPLIQTPGAPFILRNITNSVCTGNALDRFNQIGAAIERSANMQGILVRLGLMPEGVHCLGYEAPDSDPSFNASSSLGADYLVDPKLMYSAETTLQVAGALVISGPVMQPGVKKAFYAKLSVVVPDHSIVVNGESYNSWGFAAVMIDWDALVLQSGMYDRFAHMDHEFLLTRSDRVYHETEELIVLAESPGFQNVTGYTSVKTKLMTTNKEWEMTVKYKLSEPLWVIPLIVLASLCISCLVYTILVQKQLHTTMVGMTQTQEARVEMERNMTAYFAHELRNPLCAIDSALLAMPDDLPSDARDLLDGMELCSTFMSSIMNNLLDVRKLEEGELTLKRSSLSIDQLLAGLHSMLLPSIKKGVEFSYQTNTNGRNWVMGDVHRLQQVLTNVVTNAIKYTPVGSITMTMSWDNDRLRFECADTGPGIPKNEQAELFKRFVKRGGAPGTGLGLAIAKHIVDAMEGEIYFESDPTIVPGATCIVTLPLEECKAVKVTETEDGKANEAVPIEEEMTFLIVDDIQMNRMMLKRRFEKCIAPKCKITEACTGEEALEICERESFNVIIVDQYMEEAGGILLGTDTIIAMRRKGVRSFIIGCSGNDMDQEFKEAGADCVWKKPMPSNREIIQQLRDSLRIP
jgi:nitrogen-specific signal transduction histidine kinase/CheY-like chemotaxis protein